MKDNVWFINFNGIGNGIIIAPILACFENTYPGIKYFHSENEVLSNDWFKSRAGIKGPVSYSPIEWRRFKEENWLEIIDFIKFYNIGTIVNLRNEGPRYDTGYYEFKKIFTEKHIDYFELDFEQIEKRDIQRNLTADLLDLFNRLGVDTSKCNLKWLEIKSEVKGGVGFGMTASHKNKKLPIDKWMNLAQGFLDSGIKVSLFPGLEIQEKEEARKIREILSENIFIIQDLSLEEIVKEINKLSLFISNDTGLLHVAAAAGIPTVGLYIATDPNIWAPLDQGNFVAMRNPNFEKCPYIKRHCGNCLHYHDICSIVFELGDGIISEKVLESALELVPTLR